MIVASGYVEVNGIHNAEEIVNELKNREIGIHEVEGERIMFLMERKNIDLIKNEIASLMDLDGVKNVRLTYYSIEDR